MNLKYFIKSIICSALVLTVASCNSNDEYEIEGTSSDGQIITFAIDSKPVTSADTLLYPALKTTAFTLQNKGQHAIFNVDSLPQGIDIRTLKVTLTYSGTPQRVDLMYKDKNSNDSIATWNTADSVKFMKVDNDFYPRFIVIAPNRLERRYTVDFRIHKVDPDSIRWARVKIGNSNDITAPNFDLLKQGETKVVSQDADVETFRAFTKNSGSIYTYTSTVNDAKWQNEQVISILPANFIIKSISKNSALYAGIDTNGNAYTSPANDGVVWTKKGSTNVKAVLGALPEVNSNDPKNEFLVLYTDSESKLRYGKTANFDTIEEVAIKPYPNDELVNKFPVKDFSAITQTHANVTSLMIVGGKDKDGTQLRQAWRINNLSLANDEAKATINLISGTTANPFPPKDEVAAFVYDSKLYALSTDSLEMYHSNTGDVWKKASDKQDLKEEMKSIGSPSVVVDKQNYIWIFSGVSKDGTYSQQIWRGRLNKLTFKE